MAGMLPGVECARRRRFYSRDSPSHSPLLARSHVSRNCCPNNRLLFSTSSSKNELDNDSTLSEDALEARDRLKERLRSLPSSNKRTDYLWGRNQASDNKKTSECVCDSRQPSSHVKRNDYGSFLRTELYAPSTTGRKSFLKLKSRAPKEEECIVCLESYQSSQCLAFLPCGHKFHASCLTPWLEMNSFCPYCRTKLPI